MLLLQFHPSGSGADRAGILNVPAQRNEEFGMIRLKMPPMTSRSVAFAGTGLVGAVLTVAAVAPALSHPHVFVANEAHAVFENGALTGLRYRWVFDEMYTTSAVEGLDTNKDGKLDASELAELTKVNMEGLKEFDFFTTATMAGQPVVFGDAKDYGMEVVSVDEAPGPQMVAAPVTTPVTTPAEGGASAPAATQQSQQQRPGLWARISGWFSGLFGRAPASTASSAGSNANSGGSGNPGQPAEKAKVLTLTFTLPFKTPIVADTLTSESKGFQFQINDPQMFIWFEPAGPNAIGLAPGAPAGCRHAMVVPHMDEEQKKLAEAFSRVGALAPGGQGKAIAVICGKP